MYISYNLDQLDILTAKDDDVFLRGSSYSEDGDFNECVLIMTRELFHYSITKWLDAKKDFFKRYNHFCGVGTITCDVFKPVGTINLLLLDSFENTYSGPEYEDVISYRVESIEIDMEHG